MPSIQVLAPGTKVKIGDDIQGYIRAVEIYLNHKVMYTVIWWAGRERKEATVEAMEVTPINKNNEQIFIGFQ